MPWTEAFALTLWHVVPQELALVSPQPRVGPRGATLLPSVSRPIRQIPLPAATTFQEFLDAASPKPKSISPQCWLLLGTCRELEPPKTQALLGARREHRSVAWRFPGSAALDGLIKSARAFIGDKPVDFLGKR